MRWKPVDVPCQMYIHMKLIGRIGTRSRGMLCYVCIAAVSGPRNRIFPVTDADASRRSRGMILMSRIYNQEQ
jgi:hypothetical protein